MSTEQVKGASRLGRRLKADEDRKSETLRFRVREDMKRRLEAEAAEFGRSVSEEAEKRLENSFKLEELHRLIFSSGPAGHFLQKLAQGLMAIHEYQISPGQPVGSPDWTSSDATRAAVRAMLQVLIENYLPRPRTAAECAAAHSAPWDSSREQYYTYTVDYMDAMAREMTLRLVGKSKDEMKVSDPREAASH